MIILDTNVISEMMKAPTERSTNVLTWMTAQDGETLYTTTISFGEVAFGFELLPSGKRKAQLQSLAAEVFDIGLRGRILAYDRPAAAAYGRIAADRVRRGLTVPTKDVMISAIASVRSMAVATRNVRDFLDCGVKVIDPWDHAA